MTYILGTASLISIRSWWIIFPVGWSGGQFLFISELALAWIAALILLESYRRKGRR